MRCLLSLLVPVTVLAAAVAAMGQAPTYHLGRTPGEEEIRVWDITVGPEGKELPPGKGTAKEGLGIYAKNCAVCHGPKGADGPGPRLVGGKGTLTTLEPVKTIGSYWPFATTIWDYINRAMPPNFNNRAIPPEETLSPDQVYALTAVLLYWNGIIQENDVMDAGSLPKIQMPNRNGFLPPRLEDIPRLRCRLNNCP